MVPEHVMAKAAAKRRSSPSTEREEPRRPVGPKTAEEEQFTRSLVKHGQAVKRPAGGALPPGATHELVEDEHGELRPVRRRFSAI